MTAGRLIAGAVAGFCIVSVALSVAANFALHLRLSDLGLFPAFVAFALSGWLVTVRRPENRVGPIVLMTAFGFVMIPWSVTAAWLLAHDVPGGMLAASLSQSMFVFDVGGLALLLPLLFPDGHLPSGARWWRVVLFADAAYMALASVNAFMPDPIVLPDHTHVRNILAVPSMRHVFTTFIAACVPFLFVGFAGSLTAVVRRWRTASVEGRAQMKWVLISLAVVPFPFIAHDLAPGIASAAFAVVLPLVPTSLAVSILRYRLYDIDRIVSRTVSYLVVTGLLVGVYVSCIALTTSLLSFGSSLGVAAATLAAAALFQPLRRRVQSLVDRRFNRARYDAARTVDAFSARLRSQVEIAAVSGDLLDVVRSTVAPSSVSVWLKADA